MVSLMASLRKAPPGLVGWFGKVPALGDFAGRELPLALRERIHVWCSEGMGRLADRYGQDWKAAYQLAPVWHFAMNAQVWEARALIGCVAPSMDKIGRCSPVLALCSVEMATIQQRLPPRNRWLFDVERLLREVIRGDLNVDALQFELEKALHADGAQKREGDSAGEILADLGITPDDSPGRWFSWPDLSARFSERTGRSFWWAEPSPRQPPRQIIHNGVPDAELFELLLAGWSRMAGHLNKDRESSTNEPQ